MANGINWIETRHGKQANTSLGKFTVDMVNGDKKAGGKLIIIRHDGEEISRRKNNNVLAFHDAVKWTENKIRRMLAAKPEKPKANAKPSKPALNYSWQAAKDRVFVAINGAHYAVRLNEKLSERRRKPVWQLWRNDKVISDAEYIDNMVARKAMEEFIAADTDNYSPPAAKENPATVALEIPADVFAKLSRWASVARTLTESVRLLENYCDSTDDETVVDDVLFNIGELQEIRPLLDAVNAAAKSQRLRAELAARKKVA